MADIKDMQAAFRSLSKHAKRNDKVAMSEALHGWHQSALHDMCPDAIYTKLKIFVDASFEDTEFRILKGRRYLF